MLFSILFLSLLLIGFLGYRIKKMIPDQILLRKGQTEELNIGIPVSAAVQTTGTDRSKENARITTPVVSAFHMTSDTGTSYEMQLRFLGIIPLKTVQMQTVAEQEVFVSGKPIGIYLKTPGVLVIDTGMFTGSSGESVCPAEGILQSGDYVMQINHTDLEGKKDFVNRIKNSNGEQMILTIQRNGEMSEVRLTPLQCEEGVYKIGVWVRDNAQGVGTMTYIDSQGNFGALGHGINDVDTSNLMEMNDGTLYQTEIISIQKGTAGHPGEMTGMIVYSDDRILGDITGNSVRGIFGKCNDKALAMGTEEAMPIGLKQEIRKGPAQILCTVDGTTRYYDIEITDIHLDHDNVNRGIELKVTDSDLIALTGGIVQGMSGAPIIQNGKFVGAVTHVLVQDSTRGYGIFIENMLEQ